MPPIRATRRRDYRIRRAGGEPNPKAPGGDYSRIRPTHVDVYGVRYEIPINPPKNVTISVPMFFPSDDQMSRRCDGCSRSHQKSNVLCAANMQVKLKHFMAFRSFSVLSVLTFFPKVRA